MKNPIINPMKHINKIRNTLTERIKDIDLTNSKHNSIIKIVFLALFFLMVLFVQNPVLHNFTGFVIRTIEGATPTNVVVNFTDNVGVIRPDFYGVNTHGAWLGDGTMIDANSDGNLDTPSDLAWNRQMFLNSGMKYIRWDMNLQNYYSPGWGNQGFESWTNSNIGYFNYDTDSGAIGWKVSSYNGGTGYVSQSTDSHSGTYSLNVTGISGDHVFIYKEFGLKEGDNYNFSIWVKANGTMTLAIQKLSNYSYCGSKSFSGDGTKWQLISVTCNATNTNYQGYRFTIDDISPSENILVDDTSLTENGQTYISDFEFSGDLSSRIDQLRWAHNNSIRVLLVVDYTPNWLANSTSGCNSLSYCAPINYTLFGELVADYINKLTQNEAYVSDIDVEVWNEPDINFWLDALSYDNQIKADSYIKLYNSVYDSVKNIYPNIKVGGVAIGSVSRNNMLKTFLSNESNRMDFFSFHRYTDTAGITLLQDTKNLIGNCTVYGANCNRIIISEWNTYSQTIKSDPLQNNYYGSNTAAGYSSILENYPSNISLVLYKWSEQYKYSNIANYPEYPQLWSMVSEPQLDNAVYSTYNVTKNFATYHSPGSIVVNSSSDNSNVFVVASYNGSNQYITIINTGLLDADVSINLQGTNVSKGLMDLQTGENYSINNSVADIGIIPQYGITYLVSANVINSTIINNTGSSNSANNNSTNQTNNTLPVTPPVSSGSSSSGGGGGSPVANNPNKTITGNIVNNQTTEANTGSQNNQNPTSGGEQKNNVNTNNESIKRSRGLTGLAVEPIGRGFYLLTVALIASCIILIIFITLTHYVPKRKERKDAKEKLVQWIKNARKKKYSKPKIEEMLTQNNWHKDIINEAMEKAEDRNSSFIDDKIKTI